MCNQFKAKTLIKLKEIIFNFKGSELIKPKPYEKQIFFNN